MIAADDYRPITVAAGFLDYIEIDVTVEFHATAVRWIAAATELEGDLRTALGPTLFEDKLAGRRETLDAIECGDVRRLMVAATA